VVEKLSYFAEISLHYQGSKLDSQMLYVISASRHLAELYIIRCQKKSLKKT